jgi:hypothetical protein
MLRVSLFLTVILLSANLAWAQAPEITSDASAVFKPADLRSAVSNMLEQVPQTRTEWQRQYDKAQLDRSSGRRKMLIGYGAMGAGMVIAIASVSSCDYYSCDGGMGGAVLGNFIALGGGVYGSWGFYEWYRAGNKIDLLDLQKANASLKNAKVLPLSEHHAILASKSAVGYRASW